LDRQDTLSRETAIQKSQLALEREAKQIWQDKYHGLHQTIDKIVEDKLKLDKALAEKDALIAKLAEIPKNEASVDKPAAS